MPILSGGGAAVSLNPLIASSPTATPIALKPPTGATAAQTDQLEWYDDAGGLLGYIDAGGNFEHDAHGGTGNADGGVAISSAGGELRLPFTASTSMRLGTLNGGTVLHIQVQGTDRMTMDGTGLGFFAHAPVAQPATPVTLGDVIAGLRALGLFA